MKRYYNLFLLLLIILTLYFQSCKEDENPVTPTPPAEDTVKIPPTTKYITPADYSSYFMGYGTDSTKLLFNINVNNKYDLKVNDVIAFSEGTGLLRKVSGFQINGNQLTVNTVQAALEDAIELGSIEYSAALSKQNLQKIEILTEGVKYNNVLNKAADAEFEFIIDKIIYDQDNNLNTTNDQIKLTGTFVFTSDVFIKITIKDFHIQYAKYGFKSNNTANLALEAMIQYTLEKEIEAARLTFTPITCMVGLLPVIVTPDIRVKIGVSGYANAGITTSIENVFHFEAGSEYTAANGWAPYSTFTNNFDYNPPALTANCGAKAYIKPEVSMAVYSVLGGYAYGEAYGRLEADVLQSPWWQLYIGYKLGIGVRAEILGHSLSDFILDDLIAHELLIASAGSQANTAPSASFTIAPPSGNTETEFQFDAGACNDLEDPPASLLVRWDFDGDGTWDTGYSNIKTAIHTYSVEGTYNPVLEVKDAGSLTDIETKQIVVSELLLPPPPPILLFPADGAVNMPLSFYMSWYASTGAESYTLQVSAVRTFGTLILNEDVGNVTTKIIEGLDYSTEYFWRVKASNSNGSSAWSNVWTFTTVGSVPSIPLLLSPANGSYTPLPAVLSWNTSTGASSYTLQVSRSSTFESFEYNQDVGNLTVKAVTGLSNSTKYYWRVKASNIYGSSGWSEVWNFTTEGVNIEGAIAHYNFNGDADDYSGYNNHGSLYGGVTWGTNRFSEPGKAAQFNGTDGYISVPNSSSLQSFDNAISISAWIYVNDWYNSYAPILTKSDNTSGDWQYTLFIESTGLVIGLQEVCYYSIENPFELKKWYHIVISWDGNYINVYVDGKPIFSNDAPGNMLSNSLPVEMGRDMPGSIEYLNGRLDDIRIFPKPLSDSEVQMLFNEKP